MEDYIGEKYIFDLRDYMTKFISVEKLSFLAPEMYREIQLNMDEGEDKDCLIVERHYEVFFGNNMKIKISSDKKTKTSLWKFNELCESYINTMVKPAQEGTEFESCGCRMIKEIWLIPDASYEITHEELLDIFGTDKSDVLSETEV